MAKWITYKCYAIVFGETVELRFGDKVVEHRQPKPTETELEVAVSLIKHYKVNGAYNHWCKLNRAVEGSNKPLVKYKTEVDYLTYLSSDYAKLLDELVKKVYDTSLNEMWGEKGESNSDNRQEA